MKILGIRCAKDRIIWALLEGASRDDAHVTKYATSSAPPLDRGYQLAWIRKEVNEILNQSSPDHIALRIVDAGGKGNSLPRAETEGVIQEAIATRDIPATRYYSATIRGKLSAKKSADVIEAIAALPEVSATPTARRDPVLAAFLTFPKG